ncbi:MAG: anaerobic ribonucleoside-triphosphate reductase activating protein [Bacillota bacterium]
MIRYADILTDSIVDGPGIRVVTFLQGCPRVCPGCHNQELLDPYGGKEIEERDLAKEILRKVSPRHNGITFSGGDPLLQHENLLKVITYLKKRRPELNIWLYTGYLFEEVKDLPILQLVDVLVDGPYIEAQKDISLFFKGSLNQRIIDLAGSFAGDSVVLKTFNNQIKYA